MDPAATLLGQLVREAAPRAASWLQDACALAADERALFLAFALAPRQVGRAELAVGADARAEAARIRPGWRPWRWSVDQAARTCLVLALPAADAPAWLATLDRLFSTAGLQELVALYQALPLLPHGELLAERAAEGVRSSMRNVFEAVALENAFPQQHFAEEPWNQMVLKCLFMGSGLDRVIGLDARANQRLARMLLDYAHERWAASRAVDPQLWRGLGRFIDASAILDLTRVLDSGDRRAQAAAALALAASGDPSARAALAAAPPALAAAASGGTLTWAGIAEWDARVPGPEA